MGRETIREDVKPKGCPGLYRLGLCKVTKRFAHTPILIRPNEADKRPI